MRRSEWVGRRANATFCLNSHRQWIDQDGSPPVTLSSAFQRPLRKIQAFFYNLHHRFPTPKSMRSAHPLFLEAAFAALVASSRCVEQNLDLLNLAVGLEVVPRAQQERSSVVVLQE
ncbi:hypothetical protein HBI56_182780 [Parastagonospora nodorum]|nr:hypothetical protein HBH56_191260 [Parastagonospora nodorum]KAH3940709.1 hypothetical protein HBH53_211600 [Parastagonospora nodorum]KAH3994282.1 hypothetical protein HBI10_188820 [Parastagonospora nodorum]KAH4013539.1 hypothetical protein HBI13_177650 [Parastagonospora nodorum]KAH4116287.1 hypothetical protein HBH47_167140 [Parastagonospora nodorum]